MIPGIVAAGGRRRTESAAEWTVTVVDNFNDNSVGSMWFRSNTSQVVETGQQLQITSLTAATYLYMSTVSTIDFSERWYGCRLTNAGLRTITSLEVYPAHLEVSSGNTISWILVGTQLLAYRSVSGTSTQIGSALTYNASTHVYLAVGERSGALEWAWSTDGATWTVHTSVANTFGTTIATAYLMVGTWQAEASTTTVTFDDFLYVTEGSGTPLDPGPSGDFSWKGLNWFRRSSGGAPHFNGQYSTSNVSAPDGNDYVTLSLTNPSGSAPIAAEFYTTRQGFGYGTYTCVVGTRLDTLYKATVFGGLFTYDSTQGSSQSHNEIDICETSAWGGSDWDVVLDHNYYIDDNNGDGDPEPIGNPFTLTGTNIPVHTHQMIWTPTSITMRSYSGTGTGGTLLHETVRTTSLPVPENERIHFNLWVFELNEANEVDPTVAPATSVVIRDFSFVPA